MLQNFIQKDSVGQHGTDNGGMPQPACEKSQVNAWVQSIQQVPRCNRPKAHSMQVRNMYRLLQLKGKSCTMAVFNNLRGTINGHSKKDENI